ncbi:MAG TPA: secondary thiamine-phosphate synthase enzyme YjbQ [Acidobacteriota bacterium]|nr:secondary thiamine-phosphate synthase enzyme YjbQ [Acidobacteriota bacterium]
MKKQQIEVPTNRQLQLRDITRQVAEVVRASGISEGVCFVFCPHTTAGLVINENADPDVGSDLERAFEELVPKVHFDHGEGNSPAHFLSSVTRPSLQILVEDSRLQLGRWQGVYFCEFDGPRQRKVWVKVTEG